MHRYVRLIPNFPTLLSRVASTSAQKSRRAWQTEPRAKPNKAVKERQQQPGKQEPAARKTWFYLKMRRANFSPPEHQSRLHNQSNFMKFYTEKKTFEVQISTMVTWHLSVVLCSILQFKRLVSESYSALHITCGVGWLGYGGRMGNQYLAGGAVPQRGWALTPDGIHLGILAAIGH